MISVLSKIYIGILLIALLSNAGCRSDQMPPDEMVETPTDTIYSLVDSTSYNLGILLYNADQGKQFWTEFNSELTWFRSGQVVTLMERKYLGDNPYLICMPEGGAGFYGVRMSLFKTLASDQTLPEEIAIQVTGVRFNAVGFQDQSLRVMVMDTDENVLADQTFELEKRKFSTYELNFDVSKAKEIAFISSSVGASDSTSFGLDDVYLKTTIDQLFEPPSSDEAFLAWLKRAAFNFFDWNYVQISADRGVVLESYTDSDKISLSGLGYAYPIFILAGEDGYLSSDEAKYRITSMLRWQLDQNWFDGSGGWHGIPHHYFRKDGSALWPDVSTIDWAICAAGIRVVRQYYASDPAIVAMTDELLSRADWSAALAVNDKIAMGFDGYTGEMNDYRWALAFSEETEIVYLEAVASGTLDASIFDAIVREEKSGYYPSWFGAGFTYNWLQLWTGAIEPYQSNATAAFENDASTCMQQFGRPVMGLTACSTIGNVRTSGFVDWNEYISNQGGFIRLTSGSVIQVSPAPYGAALALPFTYERAMTALREFVYMGYYHPYLGLPDNVRMRKLPAGILPAPNWDPFDINIGPLILAIEMIQQNRVASWYRSDEMIADKLPKLIDSFPKN